MGFLSSLGLTTDDSAPKAPPAPKGQPKGATGSKPPGRGASPSPADADLSDEEMNRILNEDKNGGRGSQVAQFPKPAPLTPAPAGPIDITNPPEFSAIYQMAKVPTPPHGYTVDKVASLMTSPRFAQMHNDVRTAAVMATLDTLGVPLGTIVEDAANRAGSLDDYEAWLSAQHAKANELAAAEGARLQAELEAVTAQVRSQIEANERAINARALALTTWQTRKRDELAKLHAVAAMIDPTNNPIPAPVPVAEVGQQFSPGPFGPGGRK